MGNPVLVHLHHCSSELHISAVMVFFLAPPTRICTGMLCIIAIVQSTHTDALNYLKVHAMELHWLLAALVADHVGGSL